MNDNDKLERRSDALEDSVENDGVHEIGAGNPNERSSNLQAADQVRNPSFELGSGASASDGDNRPSRNVKSEKPAVSSMEKFRVRVRTDGGDGGSMVSAVKHVASTVDRFDDSLTGREAQNEQFKNYTDCSHARHDREEHINSRQADAERFIGSESKSLLSEFDDYVAAERNGGVKAGVSRGLGYGFEVGDMVWGKVKSHPWWPGHIYNEAFASLLVRRSKREGHVLVAFFGDSSYGWFEPAELIPFDSNFAEKSQQIQSRTFLKAVEEAVDEASRRCGLAFACKCRNANNFRLTNVQGYFSVDVQDYEPGGVYSDSQIRRARNNFKPLETLAFVKQLALAPLGGDQGSMNFIKNRATAFAYRRAVFEQYDETYAQAFGVQPQRPPHSQVNPRNQPMREPPKAPLSGPLVMAETLGGGRNSAKSGKVKDNSKKDRYLFKRRDEPANSVQLAYKEEAPDAAGHYVFQKRAPPVSAAPQILDKHEITGFICQGGANSTLDLKEAVTDQAQLGNDLTSQSVYADAKPSLEKGKDELSQEMVRSFEKDVVSKSRGALDFSTETVVSSLISEASEPSHLVGEISLNVKHEGNVNLLGPPDEFQPSEQEIKTAAEAGNGPSQVKETLPTEKKHPTVNDDGMLKKVKGHKRPSDDLNSEHSAIGEKKKKKKKKDPSLGTTSDHLEKLAMSGKVVPPSGKLIGKPVSVGLVPREEVQAGQAQMDVSVNNLLPSDGRGEVNYELPQLLSDLQALALDPFHGVERRTPAIVRRFFLRFRSLVYQKSLVLAPPSDNESLDIRHASPVVKPDSPLDDHVRASPLVKPVKHVRQDDPTKAGRKRTPSDRQEEIAAKRLKKIKEIKALAAEKKVVSQKTSEARRGEGKESLVSTAPKLVKPDLIKKKVESSPKAIEPTMLVIKFPPQTSLPSVAELKARFARFGPIDQSGLRVFWTTSTCRVVFLRKNDAQAAYKYAVGNNSLFGNVAVRCHLRKLGDSAADDSEVAKVRGGDDSTILTPRAKDPAVVQRQTSVSSQQPLPQPTIQLKSCLKKSSGDESGQVTGNGGSNKGTPRVKFMLGGEENSRGEQLTLSSRNNFNSASLADGGAPSSVAMDFNSKNVQKFITQPPLPIPPFPTQYTKVPQHNLHNSEMAPRNTSNIINATASVTANTVDISQQMISLLTRCNDVVTSLTGLLGYVPYHPL
ncbi:PWWP domain-containing protein 1-like [Prosopis cineraria]|uniref:PWWP domain-containing protein 1-like n=1 Tax=Prosopis cineraria TaxID=364024 RepID=UPI00240F6F3F|nr:PWWP domain-containing protein 1-like [Prosopis cineraria]